MEEGKFKNKYRIETIRLKNWDYSWDGFYFVTICTKDRLCHFGQIINREMVLSEIGVIVKNEWLRTEKIRPNVFLDEFVVMPNHFHGIVQICNEKNNNNVETHCNASLRGGGKMNQIMNNYNASLPVKNNSSKNKFGPQRNNLASIIRGFKGIVTNKINTIYGYKYFQWQSRFYEHIIKHDLELDNIRHYIKNNPWNWPGDRNNQDIIK